MNSPPPILPTVRAACLPWTAEKEAALRAAVVKEAKSWVKTPYVQQADVKGAGVDCSMLLVRCWVDTGICEPFDPRPYPPNWHMHHSEERYLEWMETLAVEVETPQAGDIAIFRFGRCYSHGGIMVSPNAMVNAWASRRTTTSDLTEGWLTYIGNGKGTGQMLRPRKFFDIFAKLRQGAV